MRIVFDGPEKLRPITLSSWHSCALEISQRRAVMFENDGENEFAALLADVAPADRLATMRRICAISEHFDAALAGVEGMIADCTTAQSWGAAQAVIRTARGR
jgi:hypothetical protein